MGTRRRGRPRKLGEHRAVSCRIPSDLYVALRHFAVEQDASLNDVVVMALREFWSRRPERLRYDQFFAKGGSRA
jgi:hypothetical protein